MKWTLAVVGLLAVACSRQRGAAWIDFEGIQYRAPAGTEQNVQDGVLPGPEGLGGIPSGQRIEATIMKPNPNGLAVQIIRTAEPVSLEGMKQALSSVRIARGMIGKTTATGWELTYEQVDPNTGTTHGNVHIIYADLDGKHYQCSWSEVYCADRQGADEICRSMRAKR